MGQILALSLHDHPQSEASTISNSQAGHETGAFQEETTNKAQGLAAELDHERAGMSQYDTNPVTEQVADEVERVTARLDNAEHFAREQGSIAVAAINTAWAEVVRGTREAHEERKRAQKMREDAKRAVTAEREEVGRAQKAVNEQRRDADAAEEARKRKKPKERPTGVRGSVFSPSLCPPWKNSPPSRGEYSTGKIVSILPSQASLAVASLPPLTRFTVCVAGTWLWGLLGGHSR